jgi:hypothetical protein
MLQDDTEQQGKEPRDHRWAAVPDTDEIRMGCESFSMFNPCFIRGSYIFCRLSL